MNLERNPQLRLQQARVREGINVRMTPSRATSWATRSVRLRFDDETLDGTVTLESSGSLSLSLTGGDAPPRR
jgi:hypothetical protein